MKPTPFQKALEHMIDQQGWGAQTKLSKAINISQQMISMMIKGTSEGTEKTRRKIAAFFNLEYEEFLKLGEKIIAAGLTSGIGFHADISAEIIRAKPSDKIIESEHINIVKQFRNKELAKSIDQHCLNWKNSTQQHWTGLWALLKGLWTCNKLHRSTAESPNSLTRSL